MNERLDYRRASLKAMAAMADLERHVRSTDLGKLLLELVRARASQINGGAYCLDMHTKDARAEGETEQRLYMLSVWRETSIFTEREGGDLRLCLFGDFGVALRPLLQSDADRDALAAHIANQLGMKTAGHGLHQGLTGITPHLASVGG